MTQISTRQSWAVFVFVCLLVTLIVVVWAALAVRGFATPEVGDSFGTINALFSGLAFAGVIYAIVLQRQELALQRRELALTREELAKSALAQERSEAALRAETEAQTRAYLLIELTPNRFDGWNLTIANRGRTAARNVKLALDKDVWLMAPGAKSPRRLQDLPLFSGDGFTIAPGLRLCFPLNRDNPVRSGDSSFHQPDEFEVSATFTTASGHDVRETTSLNQRLLTGCWDTDADTSEREKLAHLRDIRDSLRALEKIVTGNREGLKEIARELGRWQTRR